MYSDYEEYIEKVASEKVALCWIEPAQRLVVWTLHSGSIYKKVAPEFVVGIDQGDDELTEVFLLADVTSAGKWYFDRATKTVYIWCNLSANPDVVFIRATYRVFFSSAPIIAPFNLEEDDFEVEYLPLILETAGYGYELDFEQMGVALEGEGSISFVNTHGYFDDKFDKYFWENKNVNVFSWSPKLPIQEAKKIYRGLVAEKNFTQDAVIFNLKDFISKLYNTIQMSVFDGTEGDVRKGDIGTLKRRLYGHVSGLKLVPIDCTLDGYSLTGTVTGSVEGNTVTGTGTLFLDEVSPEDQFVDGEDTYKVKSVDSNTQITLTSGLDRNFTGLNARLKPKVPWRKKNREWYVAEHAIKKVSAEIQSISQANRYVVDTIDNLSAGDEVIINGQKNFIRRLSGNLIVFEQELSPLPSIGDIIYKYPIQGLNVGTTDFINTRDYDISNLPNESKVIFEELAEFNVTNAFPYLGLVTFTNGSRNITGSGTNFLTDFKTRDWIRPTGGNWYEILSIESETAMTIRTPFAEGTISLAGEKKNILFLDDDSIVTANCLGKTEDGTEDGEWIKTGSDVIRDVLIDVEIADLINEASFTRSSLEANYIIDLKLPLDYGDKSRPSAKQVIDLVNQSIFGAVHFNNDFEIEHNVITSKKPAGLLAIKDDDIISWSVSSRTDHITKEVICLFAHEDADRFTQEPGASYSSHVNDVARYLTDAQASLEKDIYLYDRSSATIINYRYSLFHESASHLVTIQTKLNLSQRQLTDKLYIEFDRLFYRLGSVDSRLKICGIISVKKNELGTLLVMEDLSNAWNKIATYAASDADIYSAASNDQKIRNGYYTNSNGIIPGNDHTYRINLYG